jgi:hypothetical protein
VVLDSFENEIALVVGWTRSMCGLKVHGPAYEKPSSGSNNSISDSTSPVEVILWSYVVC